MIKILDGQREWYLRSRSMRHLFIRISLCILSFEISNFKFADGRICSVIWLTYQYCQCVISPPQLLFTSKV